MESRNRDANSLQQSDHPSEISPAPKQNHVSMVTLQGVPIVSLTIDSKERLCLAQISSTLLKNYSYNEIHNRRVALGITCVQCTPVQLEILRRAGAMPVSSRRCGMISKREAERLVKSFLEETTPPKLPEDFAFEVTHECGWGCRGQFIPARYNSSRAKCIKCSFCHSFQSPNKFIFHHHRTPESKYNHPDAANFNSWRRHLSLVSGYHNKELVYAWEDVKAMFNGGSRKRMMSNASRTASRDPMRHGNGCAAASNLRKKVSIDDLALKQNRELVQKSELSDISAYCLYPSLGKPMALLPPAAIQHNALLPAIFHDRTPGLTMLNAANAMPFAYNPALKSQLTNSYPHLRLKYPGFFHFIGNKQSFDDNRNMLAALGSRLNPFLDQPQVAISEIESGSPQHSPESIQPQPHREAMCLQERDPLWSSAFQPVAVQATSPGVPIQESMARLFGGCNSAERGNNARNIGPGSSPRIKRAAQTPDICAAKKTKHSDFSVESLMKNTHKSVDDSNDDHGNVQRSTSPEMADCSPINLQVPRTQGSFALSPNTDQGVTGC